MARQNGRDCGNSIRQVGGNSCIPSFLNFVPNRLFHPPQLPVSSACLGRALYTTPRTGSSWTARAPWIGHQILLDPLACQVEVWHAGGCAHVLIRRRGECHITQGRWEEEGEADGRVPALMIPRAELVLSSIPQLTVPHVRHHEYHAYLNGPLTSLVELRTVQRVSHSIHPSHLLIPLSPTLSLHRQHDRRAGLLRLIWTAWDGGIPIGRRGRY